MDEIAILNNEKYLIKRKHKVFQNDDLFNKIKFNTGSDIVLQKDGIFYFCYHITDAKFEDIKENNNDIKEQSEISLVDSSTSDNQQISN